MNCWGFIEKVLHREKTARIEITLSSFSAVRNDDWLMEAKIKSIIKKEVNRNEIWS